LAADIDFDGDIAVVECKVVLRSTGKGRLYHDVIATVGVVLLLVEWMGLKGSWIEGFNLMLNVGLDRHGKYFQRKQLPQQNRSECVAETESMHNVISDQGWKAEVIYLSTWFEQLTFSNLNL
jgi:hypothetical protein